MLAPSTGPGRYQLFVKSLLATSVKNSNIINTPSVTANNNLSIAVHIYFEPDERWMASQGIGLAQKYNICKCEQLTDNYKKQPRDLYNKNIPECELRLQFPANLAQQYKKVLPKCIFSCRLDSVSSIDVLCVDNNVTRLVHCNLARRDFDGISGT